MHVKINNNTSHDLQQLEQLAKEFFPFAQERMGFDRSPVVNFSSDEENSVNPLGKTGYYSPSTMEITIFVDNRHVKDILRSLSHELVHHSQNCRGEFNKEYSTGVGYAQDNDFLRGMEDEAYREGNFCLRDWEDGIKRSKIKNKQLNETIYKRTFSRGEKNMSTKDWKNEELNKNLMERWGYKAPKELNEEKKELPYFDSSNGGDYKTSEKKLPAEEDEEEKKTDDDEEEAAEKTTNPLSVENRTTNNKPVEESKKKDLNERITYSEKLLREKLDNKDPFLLYKNWVTEPSDSLHKTTKSKKSLLREGAKQKVMDVLDWFSGGRFKNWIGDAGEGLSKGLKAAAAGVAPKVVSKAFGESLAAAFKKAFTTEEAFEKFLKNVMGADEAPIPWKKGEDPIKFLNDNGGLFDDYIEALEQSENISEAFKASLKGGDDLSKAIREDLAHAIISRSRGLSAIKGMTADIYKWADGLIKMAKDGNPIGVSAKKALDEAVAAAVEAGTTAKKSAPEILNDTKDAIKHAVDTDHALIQVKKAMAEKADLDDFVEAWLIKSDEAAASIKDIKQAVKGGAKAADEAAEAAEVGAKLSTDAAKAVKEAVEKTFKEYKDKRVANKISDAMAEAFGQTGAKGAGGGMMPGAKRKIDEAIEVILRESDEYKALLKGDHGEAAAEAFAKQTAKKIRKWEFGKWNTFKRFCLMGKAGRMGKRFQTSWKKFQEESSSWLATMARSPFAKNSGWVKRSAAGLVFCGGLGYIANETIGSVTSDDDASDDDASATGDTSVGTGGGTGDTDVTVGDVETAENDTKDAKEKVINETVKVRVLEKEQKRLEKKKKAETITDEEKVRLKQLPKLIEKQKAKVEETKANLEEKQKIEAEMKQRRKNQKAGGTILAPVGTDAVLNKRGQKSGNWEPTPSRKPFPGPHDWDGLGSMAVVRKLKELGYNYDKTQTAGGWWKKLPRMHPMRVTYRNFWKSLKKRHPRLGRKRGKKRKLRIVGYDTKRAMDVYAGGVDSSGRPQGTHKQYYEGTPTTGKRPSAKYWPKNRPWPPPNQAVAQHAYEQGLDIRGTEEGDKFLKDVD